MRQNMAFQPSGAAAESRQPTRAKRRIEHTLTGARSQARWRTGPSASRLRLLQQAIRAGATVPI